jgi:hypothetical protein
VQQALAPQIATVWPWHDPSNRLHNGSASPSVAFVPLPAVQHRACPWLPALSRAHPFSAILSRGAAACCHVEPRARVHDRVCGAVACHDRRSKVHARMFARPTTAYSCRAAHKQSKVAACLLYITKLCLFSLSNLSHQIFRYQLRVLNID